MILEYRKSLTVGKLKRLELIIFHIIFPLLLGGGIYVAFRSKSLILFRWFDKINISGFTNVIRDILDPCINNIPNWVKFSLPDGLWVYAFSSSFLIIWNQDFKTVKYWLLIPLLTFTFIELFQHFKIISGTCDLVDFFICLLAFVLSIINFKLIPINYEK